MYNCSQRKQCAHKYRRTSIYLRWIYVDTQKLSFRIYIIGLLMTELQQTSFGHNHLPCLLFFNFKWYAITSMSIRPTILALGQYFLVKWLFLFGIDFIQFIFRNFFVCQADDLSHLFSQFWKPLIQGNMTGLLVVYLVIKANIREISSISLEFCKEAISQKIKCLCFPLFRLFCFFAVFWY